MSDPAQTGCHVETRYDSSGRQINTTVKCGQGNCPQNG